MGENQLQLTIDSLKTELAYYQDKPFNCFYEYIWNSFDAGAKEVDISFSLPELGMGSIDNLTIKDDGQGWNFEKEENTRTFLSSSKGVRADKRKTLPKGRYGRGRYVFIWISEKLEILSSGQRLMLTHDTRVNPVNDSSAPETGTKISFIGLLPHFNNIFFNQDRLVKELILEFCWFLKENPNFSIKVNGEKVDITPNIKNSTQLWKNDFTEEVSKHLSDNFYVEIILWEKKPTEWSNFYFLDEISGIENFVESTRMNKQSDLFWHSVYVKCNLFKINESDEIIENQLDFGDREKKRIKRMLKETIKEKLVGLRKPYLEKQSSILISQFKTEEILPDLHSFGIFDEKAYEDLLKTVYVIAPSLFVGRDKKEQKFMCATFAGLVSVQDNNLIRMILEQLQILTEDEKSDLFDILQRTSLSCVIRTIKEIDSRLQAISDLESLLFVNRKETLEVKHLQRILNNNFWVFGEQFRLFSNTEGALKKTLYKYATEILGIENPDILTDSRKEVDLFLTRTEEICETLQKNIVIEIKRPSIKLGKAEYDQVEEYYNKIKREPVCNGGNQNWEFYLIGNDYNDYISDKIESASTHGEKDRGLSFNTGNGRYKIYVRKWSDVLQAEWGYKMKSLKEKLELDLKNNTARSSDEILRSQKVLVS